MTEKVALSDDVTLFHGDCLDVLKEMPDNSVDACVTDPPYGLSEQPDIEKVLRHWLDGDDYEHDSRGFMSASWDSFVPSPNVWREVYRVMKPGALLLAFGGTRTSDLLSIAIRFAGFELRDTISHLHNAGPLLWAYGSGFPKSADLSKMLDKASGKEREVVEKKPQAGAKFKLTQQLIDNKGFNDPARTEYNVTAPATPEAIDFSGFGSGLKPAVEPILMVRKPIEPVTSDEIHDITGWDYWHSSKDVKNTLGNRFKAWKKYNIRLPSGHVEDITLTQVGRRALHKDVESDTIFIQRSTRQDRKRPTGDTLLHRIDVKKYRSFKLTNTAANALKWRIGGINVDSCRVGTETITSSGQACRDMQQKCYDHGIRPYKAGLPGEGHPPTQHTGRWPANLLLSHDSRCERVGVRRVRGHKGYPDGPGGKSEIYRGNAKDVTGYQHSKEFQKAGIEGRADSDGLEEVEAWDCVEGCPILLLDRQSGESKSGASTCIASSLAAPFTRTSVGRNGVLSS